MTSQWFKSENAQKTIERIKRVIQMSNVARETTDVFTPIELCDEIVNKIPSLDGKILVVSNPEFVYTLLANGVNANDVYFASPCDIKNKWVGLNIPINNIIKYDNVITKEDVGDMKFDVVVGNPPYQNDSNELDSRKRKGNPGRLFTQFYYIFKELASTYAIIIPSTWMGRSNDLLNKQIFNDPTVTNIMDVTHYFPFLIGRLHVCCIISDNNYNNKLCNIQLSDDSSYVIKRTEITGFTSKQNFNIIKKLKSSLNMDTLWKLAPEIIRTNLKDHGKFKVAEVVGPKDTPVNIKYVDHVIDTDKHFIDNYRVIVNVNASKTHIGNVKFIKPNIFVTQSLRFFPVNNQTETDILISYLNSNIVKYLATTIRSSNGNSKSFFSNVPKVDLSRSWTDAELYKHFKLTKDEINLIEETIK